VQVDIVELAAVNRLDDEVGGGVSGKSKEPDASVTLKASRGVDTAVFS